MLTTRRRLLGLEKVDGGVSEAEHLGVPALTERCVVLVLTRPQRHVSLVRVLVGAVKALLDVVRRVVHDVLSVLQLVLGQSVLNAAHNEPCGERRDRHLRATCADPLGEPVVRTAGHKGQGLSLVELPKQGIIDQVCRISHFRGLSFGNYNLWS